MSGHAACIDPPTAAGGSRARRRRVHSTSDPTGPPCRAPGDTRTKTATASRTQAAQGRDTALSSAFRELHGSRLYGFALLITLGDRSAADVAAAEALGEAASRIGDLRHPERAAAWLRARAVRSVPRSARSPREVGQQAVAALRTLGVGDAALAGLRALSFDERAALVAATIERFDPIDVERIVARPPAATRRLVADARRRYLAAGALQGGQVAGVPVDAGSGMIAQRVEALAAQTLGTSWTAT